MRCCFEHLRRQLGEAETGNTVGHEAHAAVIDFLHQFAAVGLIDQA